MHRTMPVPDDGFLNDKPLSPGFFDLAACEKDLAACAFVSMAETAAYDPDDATTGVAWS